MKITIRAFADFREVIGTGEKELVLPEGETVGGVLKGLCDANPHLRKTLYDAEGRIKPYIIILKNGKSVMTMRQLETVIDEGDVIALFPSVAGG